MHAYTHTSQSDLLRLSSCLPSTSCSLNLWQCSSRSNSSSHSHTLSQFHNTTSAQHTHIPTNDEIEWLNYMYIYIQQNWVSLQRAIEGHTQLSYALFLFKNRFDLYINFLLRATHLCLFFWLWWQLAQWHLELAGTFFYEGFFHCYLGWPSARVCQTHVGIYGEP